MTRTYKHTYCYDGSKYCDEQREITVNIPLGVWDMIQKYDDNKKNKILRLLHLPELPWNDIKTHVILYDKIYFRVKYKLERPYHTLRKPPRIRDIEKLSRHAWWGHQKITGHVREDTNGCWYYPWIKINNRKSATKQKGFRKSFKRWLKNEIDVMLSLDDG